MTIAYHLTLQRLRDLGSLPPPLTHVLRYLAEVEVDHGGDTLCGQQKLSLCVAHLGKLKQERKVLGEVSQMRLGAMLHLKIGEQGHDTSLPRQIRKTVQNG